MEISYTRRIQIEAALPFLIVIFREEELVCQYLACTGVTETVVKSVGLLFLLIVPVIEASFAEIEEAGPALVEHRDKRSVIVVYLYGILIAGEQGSGCIVACIQQEEEKSHDENACEKPSVGGVVGKGVCRRIFGPAGIVVEVVVDIDVDVVIVQIELRSAVPAPVAFFVELYVLPAAAVRTFHRLYLCCHRLSLQGYEFFV